MKLNREEVMDKKEKQGKFIPVGLPQILLDDVKTKRYFYEKHVNKDHRGYFLYGRSGVGKSYQAACLLNDIAKSRNSRSHWANVPKLLENIKASYRNNEGLDIVEEYSTLPIICLDDLGTEQNTSWVMQTLYLIINSRYENMLTTVITSNQTLSELAEKMEDDRLTSRIAGMCSIIEVEDNDWRVK